MKTSGLPNHRASRGLTLIELLVVLTILVVLASVAITSTSGFGEQARYEATQRTLENVRDAVLGPAMLSDTDGRPLSSGFLADIGRLPNAVQETVPGGGSIFTLGELLVRPNGLALHAVRQASAENSQPSADADLEVYLATGWRGPYLQLAPGNRQLRDGWAQELASPNGVVPGYPNGLLRDQAEAIITAAGQTIGQVQSFGANVVENAADTGYERDLAVTFPTTEASSTLGVLVRLQDVDGTPADPVSGDRIFVRFFSPNPATGLIAVQSEDAPFYFETTTPGPRVVRAYYDTGNDGSIEASSEILPLTLRPGGNTASIRLKIP